LSTRGFIYHCHSSLGHAEMQVLVADPLKEQLKNLATTYGCSCNE